MAFADGVCFALSTIELNSSTTNMKYWIGRASSLAANNQSPDEYVSKRQRTDRRHHVALKAVSLARICMHFSM